MFEPVSKLTSRTVIFSTIAAVFITLAFNATAHKGATGIVKERMDIMSGMGKAFGAIGDMIRGKAEFSPEKAQEAAAAILEHTIAVRNKFPDTKKSRNSKHSQSLESVWTDRPGFNYTLSILEHEAEKLKQVAVGGDLEMLKTQFLVTAKSCSSCHEKYRKPQ